MFSKPQKFLFFLKIHSLLKVNFGPNLPNMQSMRKMQLCSLWIMTFVVQKQSQANVSAVSALPTDHCVDEIFEIPYDGAFIEDNAIISWVCNTSKKLGKPAVLCGIQYKSHLSLNS